MKERATFRDLDWTLLGLSGALCLLGLMEIYSSTRNSAMAGMQWKQMIWIAMGLVCMLVLSRIDYHTLLDQAPIFYLVGIGALFVVKAMGFTRLGAKRWVQVAGVPFQVSEFEKLIIILVLARFFAEVRTERLTLVDLAKVAGLAGFPAFLILVQPDLGTALTLVPVAAVGIFLAGMEWKHTAAVALIIAALVPVGWHYRTHLKPYQRQRLETFINPENKPQTAGYQVLQSEIAVGSGGFWGKGFGRGSQNQLGFVPVRYSDFILAALAEEFGFAGVFVTLGLYLALLLRLLENAQKAKDRAGMYLVIGVTAILGFHVLVNAGMVIGYMPVTGIPLPLMSYGGSATMFVFMALGLVMNVRMRRFVN